MGNKQLIIKNNLIGILDYIFNGVEKRVEPLYIKVKSNNKYYRHLLRKLFSSNIYYILQNNKHLKNRFINERVFIVGNGPSINTENLSLLKNEHVFTVNQSVRKKELFGLNPICNFWLDPVYFNDNLGKETATEFDKLFIDTCQQFSNIINIVSLKAFDYCTNHNLINRRVFFVDNSCFYYDNYKREIDLTKPIPGLGCVVQYAIITAIYMGFKEIYLLGCDETGICTKINSLLKDGEIDKYYSYKLDENGKTYVNKLANYYSVEDNFSGYARIFHLYKEINEYCKKRGVKLINCSKKTIIESIERQPLEKVIND